MCEPNHSINQFPDDPDTTPLIKGAYEKVTEWAKKIGSWFHFSKMGMGHSESIRYGTMHGRFRVPDPTRYEVEWWNRSVLRDGAFIFKGDSFGNRWSEPEDPVMKELAADALDSAKLYAEAVSIGSLSRFRNFFETSIAKSDKSLGYFEQFVWAMLNDNGRRELESRSRRAFGKTWSEQFFGGWTRPQPETLKPLVNMCMGLTRRRELLVPEWADEPKLWLPSQA